MSKGFTLIEMLVVSAIFSLVLASASGVFVSVIRSQKKFLSNQAIIDQNSYLMEYISRALRMAKKDLDGACIPNKLNYQKTFSGQGIRFKNYQGVCQEFYLEAGQLKENKAGIILPLTSSGLQVSAFNIGPDDSWDQQDNDQPKITFFLEIKGKEGSKIRIQTSISQRNLDIER